MKNHRWINCFIVVSSLIVSLLFPLLWLGAPQVQASPSSPVPIAQPAWSPPQRPIAPRTELAAPLYYPMPITSAMIPLINVYTAPLTSSIFMKYDQNFSKGTLVAYAMQTGKITATSEQDGGTLKVKPWTDFKAGELVQITSQTDDRYYAWQFRAGATGGLGMFKQKPDVEVGPGYNVDAALGDIDGDGDLDAFVVVSSTNQIWIQDGLYSAKFKLGQSNFGTSGGRAVSLGDLDGDGDIDAFIAKDGKSEVWLNNRATFTLKGTVGDAPSRDVSLGDLNGDGFLDAFMGNEGVSSVAWLNDGKANFAQGTPLGNTDKVQGVAVGDFNQDGYLDVFMVHKLPPQTPGQLNSCAKVWLNDGQANFLRAKHGSTNQELVCAVDGYKVTLADLNSDTYLDAVIVGASSSGGYIYAFMNQGKDGNYLLGYNADSPINKKYYFKYNQQVGASINYRALALADVDNDSYLDVFAVGIGLVYPPKEMEAGMWRQVYKGKAISNTYPINSVDIFNRANNLNLGVGNTAKSYGVDAGDINNDGSIDFFVANSANLNQPIYSFYTPHSGVNEVWLNQGALKVKSTYPPNNGSTIDKTDVVKVAFTRDISQTTVNTRTFSVWGKQTGFYNLYGKDFAKDYTFPTSTTVQFRANLDFKPGEEIMANLTGTVKTDDGFITMGDYPYIWQFTGRANKGSGVFSLTQELPNTNDTRAVALADFNEDTYLDAVVVNHGTASELWFNDATFNDGRLATTSQLLGVSNGRALALADFDGTDKDHTIDAFIVNDGGEADQIIYNVGNNPKGSSSTIYKLPDTDNGQAVAVGDIDHDSDLDAVVGNSNSLKIWFNQAKNRFVASSGKITGTLAISVNVQGLALGDFNQDGSLDIVAAINGGVNKIWTGDKLGNYTFSQELGDATTNSTGVGLADFNRDGVLDIFITNFNAPDEVWLNNGAGGFSLKQKLGSGNSKAVAFGDVDHDGDLDAFVTGTPLSLDAGGNRLWLNTGKGTFKPGEPLKGDNNLNGQAVAIGDIDSDLDHDVDIFVGNNGAVQQFWQNIQFPQLSIGVIATDGLVPIQSVSAGDTFSYTVTISNIGELPATNVVITDRVPVGARSNAGQVKTWDKNTIPALAQLAPGQSVKVSFSIAVDDGLPMISNEDYGGSSDEITIQLDTDPVQTRVLIPMKTVKLAGPPTHIGYVGAQNVYAFTATVAPDIASLPIDYQWESDGSPEQIRVINGDLSDVATFSWDTVGVHEVRLMKVENPGGAPRITDFPLIYTITIISLDVKEVSLTSTATALIGDVVDFTAEVSPTYAITPITYTWQATDKPRLEVITNATISYKKSYTWTEPGLKVVTVTAYNSPRETASQVFTVNIFAPPTGAIITGPMAGIPYVGYVFTGTAAPPTTTLPLTFVWEADEQQPVSHTTSILTDTMPFTWASSSGLKSITLTVMNLAGTAVSSYPFTINIAPPGSVTTTKPLTCTVGTACSVIGSAWPLTTTWPLTYVWETSEGISQTHTNSLSDTVDIMWQIGGVKLITLTIINEQGSVSTTQTITVTMFDSCMPITNVQLTRLPVDTLSPQTPVRFTAKADGSTPFTYSWTVAGLAAGDNQDTLETAPISSTVSVTVENGCGQDSRALDMVVEATDHTKPDLSASLKTVALAPMPQNQGETNGGVSYFLTYTLILRNLSNTPAQTATLVDPVPGGKTETWTGEVVLGTPVILQFGHIATLFPQSGGTVITNVATLSEMDRVLTLSTQSNFYAGFWLSINNGALYTNESAVNLSYGWNKDSNIQEIKFSNSSGGNLDSDTTWLMPTGIYTGWSFIKTGDYRLPRTVYARFRDVYGQQHGPIQANIIYDPVPPVVDKVEVGVGVRSSLAPQTVLVTSSDDNSGVQEIYLSHTPTFTEPTALATGHTTAVPWLLQDGLVYVMVKDRAGNSSAPAQLQLYPPLTLTLTTKAITTTIKPDQAITLTATVSPSNTTLPLTYTWEATDLPLRVQAGNFLTNTLTLTWSGKITLGKKIITVSATNVAGAVSSTFEIDLKSGGYYLPLIFKQ